MTREDFIGAAGDGKIVGVTFIKADGTPRNMSGRLGVRSHLRGGQKPYRDEDKGVVTLFDMRAKGYRSVKVDSIIRLQVGGVTIYEREVG